MPLWLWRDSRNRLSVENRPFRPGVNMLASKEEYQSLRTELMEHQSRRLPILGTTLTIATALLGAAAGLHSPYLPLLTLLIVHSARVQLVQAHYGVQRIAAYLRIMHEADNPELNWETGSYRIRLTSLRQSRRHSQGAIRRIVPGSPLDALLFLTNAAAIAVSLALSTDQVALCVAGAAGVAALVLWLGYGWTIRDLYSMAAERREAEFWRRFKMVLDRKRDIEQHSKGTAVSR